MPDLSITIDWPAFFSALIRFLVFVLIVAGWVWGFLLIINAYRKRRKRLWLVRQKYTTLLVQVPRNNEKGPLSSALMFASLHGIYKDAKEHLEEGTFQEHISFEIVSLSKYIKFYIYTPTHIRDFVEGQLYAQYPTVEIHEVEDYTLAKRPEGVHYVGTELNFMRSDYYPIKTFHNFEVDPLAGITGVLSQLDDDEQIWVQVLARPIGDEWQKKAIGHINDLKSGVKRGHISILRVFFKIFAGIFSLIKTLIEPVGDSGKKEIRLSGPVEQAIKAIEEKSTKLGYEVKIRIAFLSKKSPEEMRLKLQSLVGAFKQFNASNMNGFAGRGVYVDDFDFFNKIQTRMFADKGLIMNIEELASLYHLPTSTVETPSIVWAGTKKGEPPASLPTEDSTPASILTTFAQTNFRNKTARFGIKMDDRRRHMYIIGQTGTGKSTMMKNMMIDDVREGRGLAIIDPHGEFIDNALDYIPNHRVNDVVIMNPGDRQYSLGFNLLENVDPDRRELVASSMMSIFMKIWEGVWSARMEYIMKNVILALLETPGSTLLGATKMLLNKEYRRMVVENITDPVVREYWTEEYENQLKTNPRFLTEAIAPIQNKIGQFLAVPSVRNIIGQPRSTVNFKDIMDNKKILLVKISKGEIGEDNMRLLGAMIVTKIQLTAMERAGTPEDQMNDFYLYVDEFQNFATTSFATILSEARKYKLNLIIAHQYIAQMAPEVRDAVIGNAGTMVSFRVGPDDAPVLKPVFQPVFDESDLVNLSNFHIYIKLMIDNMVNPAFSATTLPPLSARTGEGNREAIITASQQHYAIERGIVEKAILDWSAQMSQLEKEHKEGVGGAKYEEAQKKLGTQYREIKDTKGGIWYVGVSQNPIPKTQNLEKAENSKSTQQGDESTKGHAGIKDVPVGKHLVAEMAHDSEIKEGESVQL